MEKQEIKKQILREVEKASEKVFGQKPEALKLGFPPNTDLGDFAVGCFPLAQQFGKSPTEIAEKLAGVIIPCGAIEKVQANGPYLNFTISKQVLFEAVFQGARLLSKEPGSLEKGRVAIEYLSPNTNKPLHLGHLRNGALGMALANLLEANGDKVIKTSLINDRGIHIAKSMLSWQKWADGATPKSAGKKPDHFVGDWYVRYSQEEKKNPELKKETQEMLRMWEQGDKKVRKLWKMLNNWAYNGFDKTYKKFGLVFDKIYFESKTYKLGKEIVQEGLKKGIFKKTDDNAIVVDLPVDEFGIDKQGNQRRITLVRADKTSVYITQDIGTAKLKFDNNKLLNESIYIVGSEQQYHFKCLFKIFEMLGFDWAKKCKHLSYGMVYLPEGKMKSREGKVVDADALIEQMEELAKQEIKKRDTEKTLSEKEIQKRAEKIGLSAIKFYLLRVLPAQDIHFNPKESISFDGFTGPYCQYAYARAASILRKAKKSGIKKPKPLDFGLLGNKEELSLIQSLIQFPEKIEESASQFNPSRIVLHIYEIAKLFNQFYQKHPVATAANQRLAAARLSLVKAVLLALKRGLNLIGIDTLEKM